MRFKTSIILVLFILTIFATSCVEEYPYGDKPSIALMVSGPDTVQEFIDSVYFKISYEDGNGDLGENNTNDENLFVTDNRNGIQYKYRIRELVPGGANVPIQGVLTFSVNNTFIIGSGTSELVTYNIHVVDRAGNESNSLTTQPILVVK